MSSRNIPPKSTENHLDFIARHGGKVIWDGDRTGLLPDGAVIRQGTEGPELHEPPPDRLSQLENICRYWELSVERAERDFALLKATMLSTAKYTPDFKWPEKEYGPADPNDPVRALRTIREAVLVRRFRLRRAEEEYASLPQISLQARRQAEEERLEHERRARGNRLRHEIASIDLPGDEVVDDHAVVEMS